MRAHAFRKAVARASILVMARATRWIAETFGGVDALSLVDAEVPDPRAGEVTVEVRAAGMNPIDYKNLYGGGGELPLSIGFEVAGVVSAIGSDTGIASGPVAVGDEVLAFRIQGGYASQVTVHAQDAFAKPGSVGFPEAANLLLAGTCAAEMLHLAHVAAGDTVLVHGAAGAVGVSVLQQTRLIGARAIGTAGRSSFDVVRGFGATPVTYGRGLFQRVSQIAHGGISAALDCVGTDEAVDVSLELVADRRRIVTAAALRRASAEGLRTIGATRASAVYRDEIRAHVIELARQGLLIVPVARTFPLEDAVKALRLLQSGHAGGKLALIPTADHAC
jgi:NADPH2:quinone reductase